MGWFEESLRTAFRKREFLNEVEILRFCIEAGMNPQHAKPIISELKRTGLVDVDFSVPASRRIRHPRPVR